MPRSYMEFLVLLVVSVAVLSALPGNISVCQCAESENDLKKVALRFLEEVADIDLDAYKVAGYRCMIPDSPVQDLHPGHFETWLDITLLSEDNELKIDVGFMDGEFYYFTLVKGTPIIKAENNMSLLDRARMVLERYRIQFNATYCAQFTSMLGQISSLDHEQAIERDEAALEVNLADKTVTFVWCPKIDGMKIRRSLSITLDKSGFLESLWDWCSVFRVGNAKVNVSREEAVNTALDLARKHADEIGVKIDRYEAELKFCAGRGDCFTLYPAWLVGIYYDRCRGFFGYHVTIWADTGEIYSAGAQATYSGETDTLSNPWAIILLVATILAVPTGLTLYQKRRHSKRLSEKLEQSSNPLLS